MKRWIHANSEDAVVADDKLSTADDSFDKRWNETFGEPSTDVFTAEEFLDYMKEVIDFE